MTPRLRPGWLQRQAEAVRADVQEWPLWMRREAGLEEPEMPTPDKYDEIAADILRRCWWRQKDHPGEELPPFAGLDVEIAAAIRASATAAREEAAKVCDRVYREHGEAVRTSNTDADHQKHKNQAHGAGQCAAEIRSLP